MNKDEIKSLDRVMSFNQVLSAATDISRAESKIFLKALLLFAGPFELVRMLLELTFSYRQIYSTVYYSSDPFIYSTGGLVSILCSAIIMALQMVIAYKVVSQYSGIRQPFTKASELVKVRPGLAYSFTGLFLIEMLIYGIVIFVMALVVMSFEAPGFIKVVVVLGSLFAFFYLYVSFSMSPFVMIAEDAGIGKSIDRSFALAKGNRWFIFGLLIVIGLMIYLVVVGMGLLTGVMINLTGLAGFGIRSSSFMLVAIIRVFTGIITLFGTGLLMLVLAVQYHNLRERLDANRLEKCVDEIGSEQ